MKYTEFFWDFDGTLFDTYGRITRAFVKGLHDLGIETTCEAALQRVKISLAAAAKAYLQEEKREDVSVEDVMQAYHIHSEEEDFSSIRPFPGVEKVLKGIAEKGGRNYLYTHRGKTAWPSVERENLKQYFSDGVTGLDGFPLKPAPDALLYLMKKHGLQVKNCIMMGDRDIDLDAGKNAGMASALFDPDHFYDGYVPDYRFDTMNRLYEKLVEEK